MKMSFNKWWVVSLVCGLLATLPFIIIFMRNGGVPMVVPDYIDDMSYYMSRMKQVQDGYPFIGNPYFKEHRSEMSGAFFVADWIATLPLFLGFSLPLTMMVNAFVWSFVFGALLWLFLRRGGLSPPYVSGVTFVIFFVLFWLVTRPVSMQIVYPFFLVFLGALYEWLKQPSSWKKTWVLVGASAVTFYIYTYLWQIVVVVFLILGIASLFTKNSLYRRVITAGALTALFASPIAAYSILQIHHPHYWDTMARVGLVVTHSIGSAAMMYSALLIVVLFFVIKIFPQGDFRRYFWGSVSVALFITVNSNVLSGKDLETAVHIGRFVKLWVLMFLVSEYEQCCKYIENSVVNVGRRITQKRILIVVVILLAIVVHKDFINNVASIFKVPLYTDEEKVLIWVRDNLPKESVILASDRMSTLIVLGTQNFPLFHPNGELYLMSSEEVIDRYLISRMGTINRDRVIKDLRLYAGAGNAEHQFRVHNRNVTICRKLHLDMIGMQCGQYITAVQNKGETYFENILQRNAELSISPIKSLQKFGVKYIISDRLSKQFILPSNSLNTLYDDGRFIIQQVI